MEDKQEMIRKLKDAGMTDEMLALYRHCCDTNDECGQERLLRRFCGAKNRRLQKIGKNFSVLIT